MSEKKMAYLPRIQRKVDPMKVLAEKAHAAWMRVRWMGLSNGGKEFAELPAVIYMRRMLSEVVRFERVFHIAVQKQLAKRHIGTYTDLDELEFIGIIDPFSVRRLEDYASGKFGEECIRKTVNTRFDRLVAATLMNPKTGNPFINMVTLLAEELFLTKKGTEAQPAHA